MPDAAPVSPPISPLPSAAAPPAPASSPPPPRPPGLPPRPPGLFSRVERSGADGARMGFMDHLMELRRRLWVSVLCVAVLMLLSLIYSADLFAFMRAPLDNLKNTSADNPAYAAFLRGIAIVNSKPLGTMMMMMWIGVYGGLVLSSPIIVYELWAFVSPALRPQERRAIQPVLFGGIFFFLAGCALAYYVLFPMTMSFVVWLDWTFGVQPWYSVEEFTSLLLTMMVICGLICEAPLVVAVLARLKLVKPSYLTRYWRPCVLGAFILGSVLSPGTDVMSMLLFTALIMSLYIVSIIMAHVFYPGEAQGEPRP